MEIADVTLAKGQMSQNVTVQPESRLPMASNEQPENESDASLDVEATSCVALVPVSGPAQCSRGPRRWLPDSNFVTHLIATAEHAPQTRSRRRASLADARSAYKASQIPVGGANSRTRQII
jgi:hypothetical protein